MSEPNWKREMHRLLEMFERESTVSLRKIKQCFGASGRPFDENFRQYFLKLFTLRFDTSFRAVQFEQMDESLIRMPLNSTAPTGDNEPASSICVLNHSVVDVGYLDDTDHEISIKVKTEIEDVVEATIAVSDVVNKEGVERPMPMQVGADAIGGQMESNAVLNIFHGDMNNESTVAVYVKREIKVENETPIEMVDLPMVVFDPNQEGNEGYVMGEGNQPLNDQSQPISSISDQKQKKRASKSFKCTDCAYVARYKSRLKTHQKVHDDSAVKRFKCAICNFASRYKQALEIHQRIHDNAKPFKCAHCSFAAKRSDHLKTHQKVHDDGASKQFKCQTCNFASRYKYSLKIHQRIHDNVLPFKCEHCDYAAKRLDHLNRHQQIHGKQKLLGVAQNPNNGLYNCTLCTQQFTKFDSLNSHLKKSHKNKQRLFNCVRCMRRFTQETEKDRHEMWCQGRRYECHLCKNVVANREAKMQQHMRTHSGAKPFPCAVCNRYFRAKSNLSRHMKHIHTAKSV